MCLPDTTCAAAAPAALSTQQSGPAAAAGAQASAPTAAAGAQATANTTATTTQGTEIANTQGGAATNSGDAATDATTAAAGGTDRDIDIPDTPRPSMFRGGIDEAPVLDSTGTRMVENDLNVGQIRAFGTEVDRQRQTNRGRISRGPGLGRGL
jgi:hypothetical protein